MCLATLQSAFLTLCSSLVTKYFTIHNPPIPALVAFSFLCTPTNYFWQQFIEQKLPAYTTNKIEVDDGGKGVEVEKKLNIRNTFVKLLFEQTIIAAINVSAFLSFTKWFQGMPVEECVQVVQEVGGSIPTWLSHTMSKSLCTTQQLWPLMISGYKLWPMVSLLNLTIIPAERRTLVGSLVGFGWNIFLAIKAST